MDNPAGWGFALVFDHDINSHPPPESAWICSCGPVKSNPQSVEGLSIGSSKTGELRAIIELFDYLLYYSGLDRGDYVVVYTDSQYVLSLLLGTSLPCTHPQLLSLAQQYYAALRAQYRVSIQKVPGHRGYPGNEIADLMAKKGVTQLGSLGRCSTSPSSPLSPPDTGFNNSSWAAIGVEARDKFSLKNSRLMIL